MSDQIQALARAFQSARADATPSTTVADWAALMFQHLNACGYSVVSSGPEDPLPLGTQGAIELRDIVEKMQAQRFSRDEAMQILYRIIERNNR